MNRVILGLFILMLSFGLSAQTVSKSTGIKKKVLDNGFTYYLYNNPQHQGKMNMYLIQKTGAILEEDSQNGLAHFLEHMCLKGTKHFPGNAIKELFHKKSDASNINAYTGIGSTNYFMTNIPKDDNLFVDQCLLIVHDWCNEVSFNDKAIEGERPVIVEEIRMRRDMMVRLNDQILPVTTNGSRYGYRNIAGTRENIENFKKEDLIRLYKDWYRTDGQALLVYGDFEEYELSEKIERLFSKLPKVENAKPYPFIEIPDNDELMYAKVGDRESTQTEIAINVRHRYHQNQEMEYLHDIINKMWMARCNAVNQQKLYPELKSLTISFDEFVKGYRQYTINFIPEHGKVNEAIKTVFGIHNDIIKNGFTGVEFMVARGTYLENLNNSKKIKEIGPEYCQHLVERNFVHNKDLYHPKDVYKKFKKYVSSLTKEDANAEIRRLYNDKNKSIIIIEDGHGHEYPTAAEILDMEKLAEPIKVEAFTMEDEHQESLIKAIEIVKKELPGSEIIKEEKLKAFKAEKWTLSNNAVVIYKPVSAFNGYVMINAESEGGFSVLERNELPSAQILDVTRYSFGDVGRDTLNKYLKQEEIQYKLNIEKGIESINIGCKYANVKTGFELLYSTFENTRFNKEAFDARIEEIKNRVLSGGKSPKQRMDDAVAICRNGKDRFFPMGEDFFNAITWEKAVEVYKGRYSDASNFIFYIIGDISKSKAKEYAEKYIGSIKSTNSGETVVSQPNPFPKGYTRKKYAIGRDGDDAGNQYFINKSGKTTIKEQIGYRMINEYLNVNLMNVLRYQENAVYGVKVDNYTTDEPTPEVGYLVRYTCAADRLDDLNKKMRAAILYISDKGLPIEFVDAMKRKLLEIPVDPNHPQVQVQNLVHYVRTGEDKSGVNFQKNIVKSIDAEFLNKLMSDFFTDANILDVTYKPKSAYDKEKALKEKEAAKQEENLVKEESCADIAGTVEKKKHGKDGYVATVKTVDGEIYEAMISFPNLEDNYKDFKIGDHVKLRGNAWEMEGVKQLTVTKILK